MTRLDRLARSTADLLGIVALLERKFESGVPAASPAAKPPVSSMASPADQASEIARLRRELSVRGWSATS